jgi:predicted nucleic acid-binding protein
MTVVLESNIVVSASFFHGKPRKCLEAWVDREFALVSSSEILEEYEQTLARLTMEFRTQGAKLSTQSRQGAKTQRENLSTAGRVTKR